jgi:hypothetical protein
MEDLFRGDGSLFQEPFQDFIRSALEIFVGILVEVTMLADEINQRVFVEAHVYPFI